MTKIYVDLINDLENIFFKDFFNTQQPFKDIQTNKLSHPADIYTTEKGIHFDIAVTGLSKDDIKIKIEDDVFRVIHQKKNQQSEKIEYLYRGISKGSFNLGFKINPKYDILKLDVMMDKGTLYISIPTKKKHITKEIKIK